MLRLSSVLYFKETFNLTHEYCMKNLLNYLDIIINRADHLAAIHFCKALGSY